MSEARGARNTIDTRDAAGPSADVDDSKVDAREHVDLGVGFSPAVKEEPAEDALDDEEETEDAAARMERSEDPERPERARRRMAARERKAESARHVGLWNLTAWLLACDDGGVIDEDDGMAYEHVDPALDSFRTLYCVRCHAYDCVLHGCGQAHPEVKLGKDPKERRAGRAEDQGGTSGGGSPALARVAPAVRPDVLARLDDAGRRRVRARGPARVRRGRHRSRGGATRGGGSRGGDGGARAKTRETRGGRDG